MDFCACCDLVVGGGRGSVVYVFVCCFLCVVV